MAELPSGTVTFLFTDIEGSTARCEHQPEAIGVALARHGALVRAAIHDHDGHVVKSMGDAFHAVFVRAPDAVTAALEAQRRLQAGPWGEIGPIRVRMAVHTGGAEDRDGDYYGPSLNRPARLMSAGHGGQVLLSQATFELIRDTPPNGITFIDLGEHRLKDLIRPERVFQAIAPDLASDFPRSLPWMLDQTTSPSTRPPCSAASENWPRSGSYLTTARDFQGVRLGAVLNRENLVVNRDLGAAGNLAMGFESEAWIARVNREYVRPARLLGAADAIREALRRPIQAENRPERDEDLAIVRDALGPDAFQAAWAEGRAMGLDDAVTYALGRPAPA